MTGICIPTSADIRIEVAGRRVAVVQSYRVEEAVSYTHLTLPTIRLV